MRRIIWWTKQLIPRTYWAVQGPSRLQREADDYAETVLRYFQSDEGGSPALSDPEQETLEAVTYWLVSRGSERGDATTMATAALGYAREQVGLP